MSATVHELTSQPTLWRHAGGLEPDPALPAHGLRLAVVGCGTSLYIAQAYARTREDAGHGETDAFPASEMPAARRYDAVLALSRSGTTTEVLMALERLEAGTPTVALTAVADSPLADAVGTPVVLAFADERSVVQTRFATTALVYLRAHLGIDTASAADAAEAVLTDRLPVDPAAFDRFHFLGSGWTVGLAAEAALKLREAGRAWTESYPAMEYRHGPIATADGRTLVVAFDPLDDALASDIRATGARLLDAGPEPLATLVFSQRLAVDLAVARGFDPDTPRNLTRSVVLS
jgi:fructoselysine-6-P-deglycase FrlB-like protein